jgi:Patatin-like phospholipase
MNSDKAVSGALKQPEPPVDFAALLWEELGEIGKLRENREWTDHDVSGVHPQADSPHPHASEPKEVEKAVASGPSPSVPPPDQVFTAAHKEELVGLAFSGGGIRSATFNLGVLQGLANLELLPMFDYLSTVSGGGYIGGWLESWIYRGGLDPVVAQCNRLEKGDERSAVRRVEECLKTKRTNKFEHGESKAIRFLREYSNYLTPRLGFLGADTWTAIAIYLRNVLLNQAVLIFFLSFLLLLPYLAVYLTNALMGLKCPGLWYTGAAAAFVLILLAQCGVAKNMTHLTGDDRTGEFPPSARQGWVLAFVAVPMTLAAWCLSIWISCGREWTIEWWRWPVGGIVAFALTWSIGALWGFTSRQVSGAFWNYPLTRIKSMLFSIISGAVGGFLMRLVAIEVLERLAKRPSNIWHIVSFGTPIILIVFLLVIALQLGLMGRLTPDPRREWWGRLGGWILIISLIWAAAFALAIYSPLGLMWSRQFLGWSTLVWFFNTLTGVLGGKSGKTGSINSTSWKEVALSVTPYVFIVGLAAFLATTLELVLGYINRSSELLAIFLHQNKAAAKVVSWIVSLDWNSTPSARTSIAGTITSAPLAGSAAGSYVGAHWQILSGLLSSSILPIAALVAAAACLFLAWRVDLNQFSMNLFYKNRLVRCYLGASNKQRKPNPFTGFDPHDDVTLSGLRAANQYSGPFPIINTSLNLVGGQNLAWQERKAESFVMTPFRCGFDTWLERLDLDVESRRMEHHHIREYGFRHAEKYGYANGGLWMGTAISVSGAAASPNMGYHSVPSLAFLMTFFNVRLGFWAGNPRSDATWMLPGPRFGLLQLLDELFGTTDDEADYVYLSDGGHFENLGLYELIKRRCKYIVVCDAGSDPTYTFSDLGNAIRKCREDLGVEITVVTDNLTPSQPPANSIGARAGNGNSGSAADGNLTEWHWSIGTVQYSLVDPNAGDGILVYLKASLTGDEPADVLNYHREHPDFPHQTTANQWFTESQFESYRRLGQHVVEQLFEDSEPSKMHTSDIFRNLSKQWETK